ncbi:MAG: LysM peptidoglycan-binding domain-containing protein [Chloroflexota bacterium]
MLLGVLASVIVQFNPDLLHVLPEFDSGQSNEEVAETPAYLGEDAPQSVEYPSAEFAALSDPAPEVHTRRTEVVEYGIVDGDSLLTIAEEFGLRAETLIWANDIEDPDLIVAGQKLKIPPLDGLFYTVRPGDGLHAIALRFGIDLSAVLNQNQIDDADSVIVGTPLFLPGGRPIASGASDSVVMPPDPLAIVDSGSSLPLPENIDGLLVAGWLQVSAETALFNAGGRRLHALPPGVKLERSGGLAGRRIQVRDPGDGRTRQAMTGYVDAAMVQVGRAPAPRELPRSYPQATRMDISHVFVPYKSQLDGGPWALANCGPTSLSMILETFGISLSPAEVRPKVLAAQGIYGHYTGTLLTALAKVAESHGLKALDLYDGNNINRWSNDEIREHLRQGHPIVAQVYYRRLPGNEGVAYYADHYVVITGTLDDGFLYNDPISHDGPGWDRVISGERLRAAMDASDTRYRYAAFAAARG